LYTTIKDLHWLQRELEAIGSDLDIEPGSFARVAYQYYPWWKVGNTKRNRNCLKELTEKINRLEYLGGGEELDFAVHRAVARANLDSDNMDLNAMLSQLAAPISIEMDDGKSRFRIGDIGSGAGKTSTAYFDRLGEIMGIDKAMRFAERIELVCIDPSIKRIPVGSDNIDKNPVCPGSVVHVAGSMDQYFSTLEDGSFDMFISSSTCHHFPFPDYLHMMKRALRPEGVIVIGDWYQLFCAHPVFTVQLLDNIGAEPDRIKSFKKLFGVKDDDKERFFAKRRVTPAQVAGIEAGLKFLTALADEMKQVNGARFFFLEALETFTERVRKIQRAGFETDIEELRDKHKGFANLISNIRKAYPDSNITNVIAAAKLRRADRPRKLRRR